MSGPKSYSTSELLTAKRRLEQKIKEQTDLNDRLRGIALSQWINDRREEDENEADGGDLYSSLGPALSRLLPYLTPETETGFHSYSLKKLTEPIHKWKAGEQASDDCGLRVSVTEVETHAGRLIEKVHCTYECHQDTRLSLDYELVNEDWAPGDEKEKRLPSVKNLTVDFSSVEPDDNLVVKGEVAALQEYCERHSDIYSAFTALDSYLTLSEARSNALADWELPERPDGSPSVRVGEDCIEVAFTSDTHGHLAVLEWRLSFAEQKLGFVESYSVEFSEVGKEQADGCGFPSELSSDGHYSFWSAKYCCENLLKMADLDTTGSTIERNLQKKHGRLDNRAQEIEIQDSE